MAKGSTGRRRSSGKSSRKLKKNQNPGIAEEILLFGAFGVAVLLFLGCCTLLGSFGKVVHSVLVGLFGMIGYVFPFIFFTVSAFVILNKWKNVTKVKLSASVVLIIVLCCFASVSYTHLRATRPY